MGHAIFHSKQHEVFFNGGFKNVSCLLSKCLKIYILKLILYSTFEVLTRFCLGRPGFLSHIRAVCLERGQCSQVDDKTCC